MVNILFINPAIRGDYNTLHLGIASTASYINEKSSHSAQIADLAFRRHAWRKYLKQRLKDIDVVAVYLSTPMLRYARRVMRFVKAQGIPVIAGGHHAIICPDETVEYPEVDFLVLGEGEETTCELLDSFGGEVEGIKGLWTKNVKNPQRKPICDLDELPPIDWELYNDLDKQLYFFEYLPLIGNRGCTYGCTFCSVNPLRERLADGKNNLYYREKSPELVVSEAKMLWEKYGNAMKFIRFTEPIFTTNIEWVREFVKEYKKAGLTGKPFSVYSMPNEFDEERARLLSGIGCKVVRTGIESADYSIRKNIFEKDTTMKDIRTVVSLCKKYRIEVLAYFIYGAPGETKKTLSKTFRLIRHLDVELPTVLIFKPLPETKILKKIKEQGCVVDEKRMRKVDNFYDVAVLRSKNLSVYYVQMYQAITYLYVGVRRLFGEIRYRGLAFFSEALPFLMKGIRARMPFVVVVRSYLSRRRVS